jgi:hypothetical protein
MNLPIETMMNQMVQPIHMNLKYKGRSQKVRIPSEPVLWIFSGGMSSGGSKVT